jgi:hypothetical protein
MFGAGSHFYGPLHDDVAADKDTPTKMGSFARAVASPSSSSPPRPISISIIEHGPFYQMTLRE